MTYRTSSFEQEGMTRDEVLARALQFLFAARQRVQRNGSAMESARTHGSSFLFAARQRVQRNPTLPVGPLTSRFVPRLHSIPEGSPPTAQL